MATALEMAQVQVGHEFFFSPSLVPPLDPEVLTESYRNDERSDVSWWAAPYVSSFPDISVLHLIRDPVDVINSFTYMGFFEQPRDRHFFGYLDRFVLYPDDPLGAAMTHYVEWNRLCEAAPQYLRVKVEDLCRQKEAVRVWNFLGFLQERKWDFVHACLTLNKTLHRAKEYKKIVHPFDLQGSPELLRMEREYGYEESKKR